MTLPRPHAERPTGQADALTATTGQADALTATAGPHLLLINPRNPLVSLANTTESRWNRYRIWKPLGLMVLAGHSPPEWRVTIVDENVSGAEIVLDPPPDLVGITAFTSQSPRAYELATEIRAQGIPVVMGGIHASVCPEEVAGYVDAVVTGEAESIWPQVLEDLLAGCLKPRYEGGFANLSQPVPYPRALLQNDYAFGSVQTTRGCPLDCSFCSVSTLSGKAYRNREIAEVVNDFRVCSEKWILVVDDNLIGTSKKHIARAKELFRALIAADLGKRWICQATLNMGDDEELLSLAAEAGCRGVFIGFESDDPESLKEIGKSYNAHRDRDPKRMVRRIHHHRILVVASYIIGLDSDRPGVGRDIVKTASRYNVDALNVLFLTPLPGTRLWKKMDADGRIAANHFPADWSYYTLGFPTARYRSFSWAEIIAEMNICDHGFYSHWRIAVRFLKNIITFRRPVMSLLSGLSYRRNAKLTRKAYGGLDLSRSDQA